MHRLLGVLRGTGEESPRAPQPGITQIDELVAQVRTAGLPVSWTVAGQRFQLSPTAELAVYRVAQEALTNVLKHAGPARAVVHVEYRPRELRITVCDDGRPAGSGAARCRPIRPPNRRS